MSNNTARLPYVSPPQPGWIRTRQRPAATVSDESVTSLSTEQQQQQDNKPALPASPSSGFASSFSAFYPRTGGLADNSNHSAAPPAELGDYPLFSSRRAPKTSAASVASTSPPFGFSPPSPHAPGPSSLPSALQFHSMAPVPPPSTSGLSALQYSTAARFRRPSVLATSSLPDEDENDLSLFRRRADVQQSSPSASRLGSVSVDGHDEPAMSFAEEDMDMDFADGTNNTNSQSGLSSVGPSTVTGTSRTAAIAIPGRARSHSQSSSVMASSAQFARSPSAWQNSPPRSGFTPSANPQHLLARLTSEQQQAMVASANSASSAYYMIPTPYRQAISTGTGGDLLLGGVDEQAIDDSPFEEEGGNAITSATRKNSSGLSRSFNPMNPYSERPPSDSKRNPGREADRDMMLMDDSPQQSPASKGGMAQAFCSHGQVAKSDTVRQSSTSTLRGSKSTPALADLNCQSASDSNNGNNTPYTSPRMNDVTFPTFNLPTPTTPPQQSPHGQQASGMSARSSLRRSQSASHRPADLLPFTRSRESNKLGDGSVPHTTPGMNNSLRFQRANSLSDFSSLQRQAGFQVQSAQPVDNAGQSKDLPASIYTDQQDMQERKPDRPPSGSSGSDSPNAGPRVVRRAVNLKKGSLMPKSKDHLRTMAQMRLETGEFEVASEAALHRISQSSAAAPSALSTPSRRNTTAGTSAMPSPFASLPRAAGLGYTADSSAGSSASGARPMFPASGKPPYSNQVKNRFPESVADEEEEDIDSSGSEPDYASAAEAGFDMASASDTGGGMMVGEDDEVSSNTGGESIAGEGGLVNRSAWTLRDPALYKPPTPGGAGRPPGEMDMSPSAAMGWSSMGRPGKRKFNDGDRFESYNSAFKRRAVSPASVSSVSLSPLLATRDLQGSAIPPPPQSLATLGPAAHISSVLQGQAMPASSSVPASPVISGGGTWLNPNKSRANSPAASTGTPIPSGKRWPEEEKERKAVDLSKMSLG